ncbi:hypothetical protein M9458_045224, partial [Cirrhinus mrigala]
SSLFIQFQSVFEYPIRTIISVTGLFTDFSYYTPVSSKCPCYLIIIRLHFGDIT